MNQRTRCSPNLARLKAFTVYFYDAISKRAIRTAPSTSKPTSGTTSGIPKANARVYEKSFLNLPYIEGLGMIIFSENEKKKLAENKNEKKT